MTKIQSAVCKIDLALIILPPVLSGSYDRLILHSVLTHESQTLPP